jgi:serine/threonine-protein kinase
MARVFQVGERVADFEIVAPLASGGMSVAYRARDYQTGADVLLKMPSQQFVGDLVAATRFEREVAIGARLDHPNICRVLGNGRIDRGFTPYVAVEFVEGPTLREYLSCNQPISVEQAISFCDQLASALGYCHAQGVVHRDLKPENVLVAPDGSLKLTDFGIAWLRGARRVTWGPLSSGVGTPDYMAPEQVRGQRGDERTDLYALGVILYELLTGDVPFQGDNALAVMTLRLASDPPPLSQVRPDLAPALGTIVGRALQRNPNDRYPTMAQFQDDLNHLDRVQPECQVQATRQTFGQPGILRWFSFLRR